MTENSITFQEEEPQGYSAFEEEELTETGWNPPTDLSFDEWQARGRTLQQIGRSLNWWLGDWLNEGERRWGQMYAQALGEYGLAVETLEKYKSVAARFPHALRNGSLSWTHHFYAAYLPAEERGPFLSLAEQYNLASRDLKQLVKLNDETRGRLLQAIHTNPHLEIGQFQQLVAVLTTPQLTYSNGNVPEEPPISIPHPPADGLDRGTDHSLDPQQIVAFFDQAGAPVQSAGDEYFLWQGGLMVRAEHEAGRPVLVWEWASSSNWMPTPGLVR